jgi:ATP-dependent Zn protease
MNFTNVDWAGVLINWFPMLLIFGVWVFFLRKMQGGQYVNQQKKHVEIQLRQADALERIAAALEKRA